MKIVMEIPEDLGLDENEVKIATIVKLYELGKTSSGRASKLLGISRIEFLDLLGKYKVQIYPNSEEDILEDLKNAYT
ncbi:MAG: UPF0175 family protein [Aquificae bacterium]|nr:UPF0175 family protein [Aquificota bacterium]